MFSRTQYLFSEFALALSNADKVIVTDIYPAREKPIEGVSGNLIFNELQNIKSLNIEYAEKETNWLEKVNDLTEVGDIIISFGAGDINKIHKQIIEEITK